MNDQTDEKDKPKEGADPAADARSTLSQAAELGSSGGQKNAVPKPADTDRTLPKIEVPADKELDSPSWHKHLEYKKGVPGDYLPRIATRQAPDPRVAAVLDTIKPDELKKQLSQLSGAEDVTINGKTMKLESRSTWGPGYELGLQFFKEKFEKDGYKVVIDDYTRWGKTYHNMRAIKEGNSKPNEVVMYGAHIDSTAGDTYENEPLAPGADDDGSGAVAIAAIAHAIKDLPLERTVVFSLFSGEEQGLWGSRAMAEAYKKNSKDKIIAMYQLDMIGCAPNSNTVESHDTPKAAGAHQLTDLLNSKQQQYGLDLKVYGAHNDELTERSDHYPFHKNGIPAVLLTEPYDTADQPNPTYHSTRDTVEKVNMPFVANIAKAAAAAGIELAGLRAPSGVQDTTPLFTPTPTPVLTR